MPRITYQSILHNATPYNLKQMQHQSISWFRQQIMRIRKNRYNKQIFIQSGRLNTVRRLQIGKMYMFSYVPKYIDSLPVFDRFPLVLPFNIAPNGFYALNLHYIPIKYRAMLLDRLLDTANLKTNKLKLSWQILNNYSRIDIGQYATHRYLLNHITSPFRLVQISDYAKAIMLPQASWYGKDRSLVNYFRRMI